MSMLVAATGCARVGGWPPGQANGPAAVALRPAPEPPTRTSRRAPAGKCPAEWPGRGFSCLMRWRIRAAQRYLARQPGRIGVVLHDRVTGATWRDANARAEFPAASTMKLAMVTDLLVRIDADRI